MPSGFTTALPNTIALGVGVLYHGGTTVFGVSEGGIRVRQENERENLPFDNKMEDIQGLDLDWGKPLILSGEFIQISDAMFSGNLLMPGATAGTAGTPTTVTWTPKANATLFASGDYITNLVYEMTRGDTKKVRYVAPVALVNKYEIIGQTKKAHKISAEFKSILGSAAAASNSDTASFKVEIVG